MANKTIRLSQAIVLGSLLLSGALVFFAVSAFSLDWFGPAMIFLAIAVVAIPWIFGDRAGAGQKDVAERAIVSDNMAFGDIVLSDTKVGLTAGSPVTSTRRRPTREKLNI